MHAGNQLDLAALAGIRALAVQLIAKTDEAMLSASNDGELDDTTTQQQVRRLILALGTGPKTTFQLRDEWNVMAPSQRAADARKQGYRVTSHRVSVVNAQGHMHHKVALYSLGKDEALDAEAAALKAFMEEFV